LARARFGPVLVMCVLVMSVAVTAAGSGPVAVTAVAAVAVVSRRAGLSRSSVL
jgi:hypothetical protein